MQKNSKFLYEGFIDEDWNCKESELLSWMKNKDFEDRDMTKEKDIRYFLEVKHGIVNGNVSDRHISTVMSLAGKKLKMRCPRCGKNYVQAPAFERHVSSCEGKKESLSYQEIMDLPDWTQFENGCFMTMKKKYKGRPKHFTMFVDSNGLMVLEKAMFVPPETQPVFDFDKMDTPEWGDVFNDLVKTYHNYIWFVDEDYYSVLAACAMSTYFREIFDTYPYCDFYAAELNCGKTTAMKALIWSSFHGFMPLDPTGPVIFRAIDSCKSAIGIDEVDNLLKDPDASSRILGLLNAAYQKGLIAYRISMEEGGMPIPYDPFGLKAFTHVKAIPESISSRSIVFSLIRSPKKLPLLRTADTFTEYRNKMYKLRLMSSDEVEAAYLWVSDFVKLANRPKDIFLPPLTMAKLVSDEVFSRMYRYAQNYAEAMQTEQFDEVKRSLVEVLLRYTGHAKVKLISDELGDRCHEIGLTNPDKDGTPYSFHSRTVLRMLSSMGIHKSKKRTDHNVHVFVDAKQVRHWAVAYKIIESEDQKVGQSVADFFEEGDGQDHGDEKSDFLPLVPGKSSLSSLTSRESSNQKEDKEVKELSGGTKERKTEILAGDLSSFMDEFDTDIERTPVDEQVPDVLKKLVRRWKNDDFGMNDEFSPKESGDTDLLMRGLEAGYVLESKPGLWGLTDIAKEESGRWKLFE